MASLLPYKKIQRQDKGFDFYDDRGRKIGVDQYVQATGVNKNQLVKDMASSGDRLSQSFVRIPEATRTNLFKQDAVNQKAKSEIFNPGNVIKDVSDAGANLAKMMIGGIQQGAGIVGDVALQGGAMLGNAGIQTNPLINEERRKKQTEQFDRRLIGNNGTEAARKQLQNLSDIQGNKIIGTSDVDANASRIATGNGDFRDVLAVGGKALDAGLSATMFATPTALARGATGNMTGRQILNFAGKDALMFGGTQGVATGAQVYGQTGDALEALKQGATAGALTGLTQGTLDGAGLAFKAIPKNAADLKAAQEAVQRQLTLDNLQKANQFTKEHLIPGGTLKNEGPKPNNRQISQTLPVRQSTDQISQLDPSLSTSQGIQTNRTNADIQQVDAYPASSFSKSSTAPTINTNRYNITDKAKQTLTDTVDGLSKDITERTGRKLSLKEVATVADETTNILKTGKTREATLKATTAMQNARQKQAVLAEKMSRGETLTPDEQADMVRLTISINTTKTDLARQLGSLRNNASARDRNIIDVVLDKLSREIGDADAVAQAAKGYDLSDMRQLGEFYRSFVKATPEDWLDKLRYNSMLSSPVTHSRNIFANVTGASVIAPTQKVFEGATDAVRAIITGTKRTRYSGEAGHYAKAYLEGMFSKASRDQFTKAMKGELGDVNVDMNELYSLPLATKGFAGAVDKVLSFTTRLTDAVDQWAIYAVRKGEEAGLTYRQSKGVDAGDISSKALKAAEYRLFRNKLGNKEEGFALRALDYIPQKVLEATRSNNPAIRIPAKLTFPFIKTPTNVAKQMIEFSPLGLANIPGAQDKTAVIAKAIMGTTAIATVTGTLAANDSLTFGLPTDPKEREKFLAEGKQAYSFKVGDKWLSYQYLHPSISFNMAAVASVNDAIRKGDVDEDTASKILEGMAGASRFFVDQSYFKNAQDFLSNMSADSFSSPATMAAAYTKNVSSQFVPFRALATWVKNMVDPTQRKVDTSQDVFKQFIDNFQKDLPGLSQNIGAYKDALGNDVKNTDTLINAISPIRVKTEKSSTAQGNTKLDGEINRLYKIDEGIKLGSVPQKVEFNGIETKLDSDQRKQLDENINSTTKVLWDKAIADERYAKLNDEDKRKVLSSIKSDVSAGTKDRFAQDYTLGQYSSEYTEEQKKLSKREQNAIASNPTIDSYFNSSSSSTTSTATTTPAEKYQTTLADYEKNKDSMSDIKRYAIENSLKKLKINAPYSNDLIALYDMSKEKINDFVTTSKDGKKLADQLFAYDKALYEAGLTKYLKFKTGIAPATKKASSKKGRKGGKGRAGGKSTAPTGLLDAIKTTQSLKTPKFASAKSNVPSTPAQKKMALRTYSANKSTKIRAKRGVSRTA